MERIPGEVPLTGPEEAAEKINESAQVLVSGFGSVGYPKAMPVALADSDRDIALTVISGGSLGDEFDNDLVEEGGIKRRFPYQSRSTCRQAINEGKIAFQDYHVSEMADKVKYSSGFEPDIAIVEAIAVGEDWLIPSTSIGHTPAYIDCAPRLIVEVNSAQPTALEQFHDIYKRAHPPNRLPIPVTSVDDRIGQAKIQFDPEKLEAVIAINKRDDAYEFREPTETDLKIASNFGRFLSSEIESSTPFADQIHLQFGVGSLGNALMSVLNSVEIGERDLVYFGEVIQDGLLEMLMNGNLLSASATSLAMSREGQDKLFNNIESFSDSIVLRPTSISNNPELINRFGVIAVNSALEVDIYGNVNSTHLHGTRMMNGIGGSGDFIRHALISIIVLSSTVSEGNISKIRPWTNHVDHTEHDVDVVITEQGIADLRGTSPKERSELIVERCAHPSHQEKLQEYLEEASQHGGHIPHNYDTKIYTK